MAIERILLYIDNQDPMQKELCDILKKIPRKKTKFLSILVHDFKGKFKEPDNITESDLKKYMEYYDLIDKMNFPSNNNEQLLTLSQLINDQKSSTVTKHPSSSHTREDRSLSHKDTEDTKSERAPNEDDIMKAMNVFSID